MPSFLSTLTSYFTPSSSSSSSHPSSSRPNNPRILSSTQDAFSLPSHNGSGGYGYGYGRGDGDSRSGSPAFGDGGGGLSRPDRANLGKQGYRTSSPSSRQNSFNANGHPSSSSSAAGGFVYPPPAMSGRMEGGNEYSATGRIASGSYRNASPSGSRPRAQTHPSQPNFFSPNGPLIYYPPLRTTWNRIRNVLLEPMTELHDSLNGPVDPLILNEVEAQLGCVLPPSVRDSFIVVDGQDPDADCREGLFFGLTLLSLEDALREWQFWRQVEMDPSSGRNPEVLAMMSSIPPGWVKSNYASRGWLPLISDKCGNYVGVDLDPGEDGGAWGQVIVFGREFDRKCVLWRGEGEGGWGRWLAGFAEELESGEGWEVDGSGSRRNSDGSDDEDDIGYKSYYFDGGGSGGGGGDAYGEAGAGLRLTGEYRGWGVLEAWWDRSVKKWDELGMGLIRLEETERESEAQAQVTQGRRGPNLDEQLSGLGFAGMRLGGAGEDAQVAIPVLNDPNGMVPSIPAPNPPLISPGPDSSLLPPRSPTLVTSGNSEEVATPSASRGESSSFRDYSADTPHAPTPRRLITPYSPTLPQEFAPNAPSNSLVQSTASTTNTYASSTDGLLSPPAASPRPGRDRKRQSMPAPAPAMLDLPTRADVQAAQAVAMAEEQGLRGGWVMSMETVPNKANAGAAGGKRNTISSFPSVGSFRNGKSAGAEDSEMVDIDLEGGKMAPFGSPKLPDAVGSRASIDRQPSPLASGSRSVNHSRRSSATVAVDRRTPSPSSMHQQADETPRPRPSMSNNNSYFAVEALPTVVEGKGKQPIRGEPVVNGEAVVAPVELAPTVPVKDEPVVARGSTESASVRAEHFT